MNTGRAPAKTPLQVLFVYRQNVPETFRPTA
jgi:hypothetical protein